MIAKNISIENNKVKCAFYYFLDRKINSTSVEISNVQLLIDDKITNISFFDRILKPIVHKELHSSGVEIGLSRKESEIIGMIVSDDMVNVLKNKVLNDVQEFADNKEFEWDGVLIDESSTYIEI